MISVSRFIYEIALNLTMIESDPVQTPDIPYPPPSHASLTLAPLAINLKCTRIPGPDWPTLPLAGLLLAPINADHSRSDFPARDLDFVPPSALPVLAAVHSGGGGCTEQARVTFTTCRDH